VQEECGGSPRISGVAAMAGVDENQPKAKGTQRGAQAAVARPNTSGWPAVGSEWPPEVDVQFKRYNKAPLANKSGSDSSKSHFKLSIEAL